MRLIISIHLMLLFIKGRGIYYLNLYGFQYISCYCLSVLLLLSCTFSKHFNTSHVTVYQISSIWCIPKPTFQYISCYCLSTSSRCPILVFYHFNTSHVTVYQEIQKHKGTCNVISIHLMLLFIRFIIPPPFLTGDFNTSHVTVYQEILLESQYQLSNFNTSHVTVYHRLSLSIIHFIKNFNTSHVTVYPIHFFMYRDNFKFQYISCYCLSIIANMNVESTLLFQYISCYCLSAGGDDKGEVFELFQYISCYCLSAFGKSV